jgi:hypothetical protein
MMPTMFWQLLALARTGDSAALQLALDMMIDHGHGVAANQLKKDLESDAEEEVDYDIHSPDGPTRIYQHFAALTLYPKLAAVDVSRIECIWLVEYSQIDLGLTLRVSTTFRYLLMELGLFEIYVGTPYMRTDCPLIMVNVPGLLSGKVAGLDSRLAGRKVNAICHAATGVSIWDPQHRMWGLQCGTLFTTHSGAGGFESEYAEPGDPDYVKEGEEVPT